MEYLEGNEPDEATLKRLIRKGCIDQAFVPVVLGTAFKNKGVQPLLDAVVDYMPSPLDVEAIAGMFLSLTLSLLSYAHLPRHSHVTPRLCEILGRAFLNVLSVSVSVYLSLHLTQGRIPHEARVLGHRALLCPRLQGQNLSLIHISEPTRPRLI
eukprot:1679727-Rhodomonas_salina.1